MSISIPSRLAFAGLVTVAGFIAKQCATPPNPPPITFDIDDPMSPHTRHANILLKLVQTTYVVFGILHATVALTHPTPPSAICPHPEHLDPRLFSWTVYSTTCLVLLVGAGLLRLSTYAQLGKDFTFQLAPPERLVTSGVYRYVQHPSYSAYWTLVAAFCFLYYRQNGVIGCWLWSETVNRRGVDVVIIMLYVSICVLGFSIRVRPEEAMLKKTFGKEWEVWHARTKRFVPGVI